MYFSASELHVGIDIEEIARWQEVDLRLFSADEIAYCQRSSTPAECFAGRWVAKEAVVKALMPLQRAKPPSLRDVEIVRGPNGEPVVRLSERTDADNLRVAVSISHSAVFAIAVAVATRVVRQESSADV